MSRSEDPRHPSERGPCELDIPPEDTCTLRAVHFTYMLTSQHTSSSMSHGGRKTTCPNFTRGYSWPKVWKRASTPASPDAFSGRHDRDNTSTLSRIEGIESSTLIALVRQEVLFLHDLVENYGHLTAKELSSPTQIVR